ncbi:hypothetical protein AVEN_264589-1 [Araneus ventricosus]|uniref:Uncharacterized protein n=1 Tax=Araneus ventricosus TaxID=182803 RepID=A0A4Y2RY27_ARAVE|nr:hypothetical protein AVEN_264589-1 [Araneus ventricosus]
MFLPRQYEVKQNPLTIRKRKGRKHVEEAKTNFSWELGEMLLWLFSIQRKKGLYLPLPPTLAAGSSLAVENFSVVWLFSFNQRKLKNVLTEELFTKVHEILIVWLPLLKVPALQRSASSLPLPVKTTLG